MQIQRVNNLNVSNNRNNNKQSFGMIKFSTSGNEPKAIIEAFDEKDKHVLGVIMAGKNKLFHILKTKFGSMEEKQVISQLNRLNIKAEPILDSEGEEIIKKAAELDSQIDDTILNDEPFAQEVRNIMNNNSYD